MTISSFQLEGDIAAVLVVVLGFLGLFGLMDHKGLILRLLLLVVLLLGLLLVVVLSWLLLPQVLAFLLLSFVLGFLFLTLGLLCSLLTGLTLELEALSEVVDLKLHPGHLQVEFL